MSLFHCDGIQFSTALLPEKTNRPPAFLVAGTGILTVPRRRDFVTATDYEGLCDSGSPAENNVNDGRYPDGWGSPHNNSRSLLSDGNALSAILRNPADVEYYQSYLTRSSSIS